MSTLNTATNTLFILCDMIEKCFTVMREEGWKPENIPEKYERKHFTELEYWAAIVRKKTSDMDFNSQVTFGEESDHLMRMMLSAIDKTGDNMRIFTLIQNYIDAFDSHGVVDIKKFGL